MTCGRSRLSSQPRGQEGRTDGGYLYIAARFPQYDFLNGGVASYSPSNYLNVTRMTLAKGVEFDEAIVFIDISDTQDEAAYYRDVDGSGAVAGPAEAAWRPRVSHRFGLTNSVVEFFERALIGHGYYHLITLDGNLFDWERAAWTYRKVSDTKPFHSGYAPLGLEGGIAEAGAGGTRHGGLPVSAHLERLVRGQVPELHFAVYHIPGGKRSVPEEPAWLLVLERLRLRGLPLQPRRQRSGCRRREQESGDCTTRKEVHGAECRNRRHGCRGCPLRAASFRIFPAVIP